MNSKKIYIAIIAVLSVLGVALAYLFISEKRNSAELVQEFEMNKSELENEYAEFAMKYQEIRTNLFNDSLSALLEKEQVKTQRLLEELRMVKSTNAAEIRRLKKELANLRQIMVGYINQIDSLNRLTVRQKQQIEEVTQKYNAATVQISNLSEEKQTLNKKVTLAAQLDATAINMTALNEKGKIAKRIKSATKLQVTMLIAKNVTADNGERTIYVRISTPDGQLLTKNSNNTFQYEDKEIGYSVRRTIEYSGEEQNVTLYWDIEEYLPTGVYRVDIFESGNLIGSKNVEIKK